MLLSPETESKQKMPPNCDFRVENPNNLWISVRNGGFSGFSTHEFRLRHQLARPSYPRSSPNSRKSLTLARAWPVQPLRADDFQPSWA